MQGWPQGIKKSGEIGLHLFRIYLDNYDELKKVDRSLAEMVAGTPSAWTLAVRQTYETLGLPRHPKKAVMQSVKAEVQGAWVGGELGRAGPKPEKVMRYVKLACEAVIKGKASQRELQVIGGGFVYIAMFRRPLLAGLNAIWRRVVELDNLKATQRASLGPEVEHEIIRFVALTPLAYMDFRTPISEKVTASDASTTGGGLCVSRNVSPYGIAASLASCRGDVISQDEVYRCDPGGVPLRWHWSSPHCSRRPSGASCWVRCCGDFSGWLKAGFPRL